MIVLKEFPEKTFSTPDEAVEFLVENKKFVISQKKSIVKHGDGIDWNGRVLNEKKESIKADGNASFENVSKINIIAVSNTCNYYDSHGDVSLNGSWKRTANNTKDGLHLQEHKMQFDKIISDQVEFKVEIKTWKELGFNYEGSTECLVMYSTASKEDNPYMFDKYVKGKVKQHSVGLRYINIDLAVNSSADWAKDEKELWDKYYPMIVNKDDVDEAGYFWCVFEQKAIENSAVPRGSNPATPTISVEPVTDTSTKQDSADATPTDEQKRIINLNLFI
ncbi:hypothetical protein BN1195_03611 [Chryseobacterium oranimense G311]|uniref:hypothetical protein n=1 Tax=Chryseobacterium oranimense TaxID=421058 RepID=UPI0005336F78|nr:hypothetical protein [Chryseobacterium oranimense]CEJ71266.1 hypothetical protein BN1195_03611 [Chryseobacterium oranimense G311]DAG72868.1 MAG TPA: hypothetical protein [Caudoviricetes sp.]